MDDFDDWFDSRDFHISMGGSTTVAFARQAIFDRAEHFRASIAALEHLGMHNQDRSVILEFELEAYFFSVFSCLEQTTVSACGDVQSVSRVVVSYHDIRGRSIFDRAIKFLQLVETVETIDKATRDILGKYQIVRHAIAHGVGVGGIAGKKLETILQLPGIAKDSEGGNALLSKEFCEQFIEFAERYVAQLEKVISAFGARAQQKVTSVT